MLWNLSNRADPAAAKLADRHYNRQKIGSRQFVPPGRCIVLLAQSQDAFWVSSFPYAEYVKHDWPGAWICSAFRNESSILSSVLISEAVSVSRFIWGDPPPLGMITFIDMSKVRKKRDFGRCYRKAGFVEATPNHTKGGLLALQLLPENMPKPQPPNGMQLNLFGQKMQPINRPAC